MIFHPKAQAYSDKEGKEQYLNNQILENGLGRTGEGIELSDVSPESAGFCR